MPRKSQKVANPSPDIFATLDSLEEAPPERAQPDSTGTRPKPAGAPPKINRSTAEGDRSTAEGGQNTAEGGQNTAEANSSPSSDSGQSHAATRKGSAKASGQAKSSLLDTGGHPGKGFQRAVSETLSPRPARTEAHDLTYVRGWCSPIERPVAAKEILSLQFRHSSSRSFMKRDSTTLWCWMPLAMRAAGQWSRSRAREEWRQRRFTRLFLRKHNGLCNGRQPLPGRA